MKPRIPLRMAFAVPVLYAFLAVFFLDGNRRAPERAPLVMEEPPLTAGSPVSAAMLSPSPTERAAVSGQTSPGSGDLVPASPVPPAISR